MNVRVAQSFRGIPDRYLGRSVGVPVAPTLRSPKRGKVGWVERRAKPTVGLAAGRLLMGFAIAQPILRHHSRASRKIHCLAGWGKRTGRPTLRLRQCEIGANLAGSIRLFCCETT